MLLLEQSRQFIKGSSEHDYSIRDKCIIKTFWELPWWSSGWHPASYPKKSLTVPTSNKKKKKYQKSVALQKKSKSLMHYRSNNKMRQLWNCLKRFSCSLSDNESISKKSKESLQLNNKTQIIQLENKQIWIDIFPHTHTHKICIQMANRYMKGCSTWLIIREMQIKITVRYLYVF